MTDYEILGAATEPALLLRLRNLDQLAVEEGKKQGGAAGAAGAAIFSATAPRSLQLQAYTKMAEQLRTEFAKRGADLDVRVISTPPEYSLGKPRGEFLPGVAVGAGTVGLVWIVKALVSYFLMRR